MTRETWATRIGFILAAVGSAVGLGNIWRFPFITAESGGAAFVLVYLLLVVFLGLPVMLVEFVIGRESKQNVIDAFPAIGRGTWKFIGVIGAFTGFVILSYYSVVGGWVIRYIIGSLTGAYMGDAPAYFGEISTGMEAVAFALLFVAVVAGIVVFGVRDGLERAAKVMIPSVVGLLLVLAVYGATLSGAGAGYEYYLSPNVETLAADAISILPAAAGQAFFTLSLGMGIMITYGSYLDQERSLLKDSLVIVVVDTFVAILSGLVVFPILFARGVDPGTGGIGTTFVGLAGAFAELPAGEFVGAAFFVMLFLAALTSAFSILEVIVSFAIDTFDVPREHATVGSAALIFLVGIPTALDLDYLTVYDAVANNVLLILGGLLLAIFAGWVYAEGAMTEFRKGLGDAETLPRVWIWILRIPVILVLAYVLSQNGADVIETVRGALL
ncbi:MAG: NSS family neurotransmitter:Na+ symporter [Natronomonas sp.]|jgi:NSS family neurotransmitter:Na+ symporter